MGIKPLLADGNFNVSNGEDFQIDAIEEYYQKNGEGECPMRAIPPDFVEATVLRLSRNLAF